MAKTAIPEAVRRSETYMMNPDDLTIITDPANPFYDPRSELPLDEWLVESIMAAGKNYSPITIRKNGKYENGRNVIEVIDGRQRLKAIREINRRYAEIGKAPLLIEAEHMTATEEKDFIEKMATLNECRIKTPPSMIAMQIDRYIESGGTYKEAERAFHMSEAKLRQFQAIARLCDDVKKAVDDRSVSMSAAQKFTDMSVQQQRVTLKQLVESGEKVTAKSVSEKKSAAPSEDGGIPAPRKVKRMRSRREIEQHLRERKERDEITGPSENVDRFGCGYDAALKWVLCETEKGEADVAG